MQRSAGAMLVDAGRRKGARALHILQTEGAASLVWDSAMVGLKPARARYENLVWKRRRRGAAGASFSAPVQGQRMYLNPRDVGISKELAVYGVHEPLATQLLRQIVTHGMTVLDIGANIGYYALIEGRLVGDTGRVFAIEPVESNYDLLVRNVAANRMTSVTTMKIAIGAHNGTSRIYLSEKSNRHSLIQGDVAREYRDIDIMTLDHLVETLALAQVDLLRMDIEGYEFTALEGMISTLRRFRPAIFLELHPHVKHVDKQAGLQFVRRLKELDYDVDAVIDRIRDEPWRSRMATVERMSIDDLLCNRWLTTDRRVFSVLFRPRPAQ